MTSCIYVKPIGRGNWRVAPIKTDAQPGQINAGDRIQVAGLVLKVVRVETEAQDSALS